MPRVGGARDERGHKKDPVPGEEERERWFAVEGASRGSGFRLALGAASGTRAARGMGSRSQRWAHRKEGISSGLRNSSHGGGARTVLRGRLANLARRRSSRAALGLAPRSCAPRAGCGRAGGVDLRAVAPGRRAGGAARREAWGSALRLEAGGRSKLDGGRTDPARDAEHTRAAPGEAERDRHNQHDHYHDTDRPLLHDPMMRRLCA